MYRRSILSAFLDGSLATALFAALVIALFPGHACGWADDRAQADGGTPDGGDGEGVAGSIEGPPEMEVMPPSAKPPEDGARPNFKGRVLVIPTRTDAEGAQDSATFDVLLAAALQEIGFDVVELGQVTGGLRREFPSLERARELYLDLKLEEALEQATAVRDAHASNHGDLVGWKEITEAELFMVKLLLDLGRVNEALDTAVEILVRHPSLRLDPVQHAPAMQALWLAAIERGAARQPPELEDQVLCDLGGAAGVDWVAAAIRKKNQDGGAWLVIKLVPAGDVEKASRHALPLGPKGMWAREVRLALQERFPPPPEQTPQLPPEIPPPGGDGEENKVAWYRSWWFWTVVGVVVVGGTAGGLSAYYSSRDDTPRVSADFSEGGY